jgi:phosphatidylglycerophosphate synthase
METSTRELTFLLAEPERRLLRWIAARLPARVTSDHLTALGVIGALGTGAAYGLSAHTPFWLGVACLGLAINWFGDSLDGTLARVRHHERPRYGYYLDHVVDVFTTAAIGVGLGLSPYIGLSVALALVVAYLALSINIYLESHVFGVFRLAYGKLGPTEVRLILVLANVALALGDGWLWTAGTVRPVADIAASLLAGAMGVLLVWRFCGNVAALARLEPPKSAVARPIRRARAAAHGLGAA